MSGMSQAAARVKRWREDPTHFVHDAIQVEPSNQQYEGLAQFKIGSGKPKRITIRSGHGTGKDAFASWIIWWFLSTRRNAKVICTAPTARQLADILWSETSKWLGKSILRDEFVVQKDKIFHKSAPKEWWCRAVSVNAKASKDEQSETLAGFHGDNMLIVCDEASGIPDPVFIPLEGAMTQEDNWCLMIGNMTQGAGYFYDSHFHPDHKKDWNKLHWNSEDSTNVSKTYIDYMARKYGKESNVYAIRVLGNPPSESEKTLIPLSWAIRCVGNEIQVSEDEPMYLGVDVARYGEDASIILPREANLIHPWKTFRTMNTISLGGHVIQTVRETDAQGIAMDEIGVGAGVTDWLQKRPMVANRVFGINVSEASSDKMRWHRLRDELWLQVRDKVMKGAYSFPDILNEDDVPMGHELANELALPTYDFDSNGAFQVESKQSMKKRASSPNIADALCLSEYFANTAYLIWSKEVAKQERKRKRRRGLGPQSGGLGNKAWMVR